MATPNSTNRQKNHDYSRRAKKRTSGAEIFNAETRTTLPYPVSPLKRQRLPPLQEYVGVPPTYVGWRKFCRLGNGIFPREGWRNVWGEGEQGYIRPVLVEYGHGVLDSGGPATAEKNYRRVNARPSRFIITMANATEKAKRRGERVAALKVGGKNVSSTDRSIHLEHPRKTHDEAAVPAMLKVCSSVEICHPKPQTFPNLRPGMEFGPHELVASSYMTCAGATSVWGWLGNDEVANRRFEAYEARRGVSR